MRLVSPQDPVVQVRRVTKWFAETTALEAVDLTLSAGSVHGLLGPNGAGKTTLLSMLFGLVRPDEGTVRLFGRTLEEARRSWLDGVGGFVESPRFYPYLSGRQNLDVLIGLDGTGRHGDGAVIGEAMDLVGLDGVGRLKVRGYSLGMRQRLGLAAALIRRPRLLILDEPGNGLDPAGLRDLRAIIRRLADEGLAVLLSSHDIGQVSDVCDAVTVLRGGQVAFTGSLSAMRAAAPRPVWGLRTSDDRAAAGVAVRVLNLSLVTDPLPDPAADRNPDLALRVVADQEALDEYTIRLGRAGIAVRELFAVGTPLEALFFELTQERPAGQVAA
jgi:ABC-2 type transport system ATP-binding protein